MRLNRFATYAWGVLGYNLFVILWGAYVRATGSGAGCGAHWPLCNGQVIPRAPQIETMIEFAHRITSGLAGLLVIGMVVWAVRAFPKGHLARRGAWLSLIFIIIEGLLGAALVRFELVAENSSMARAFAMGLHLVNTLILIGVVTLTAWWGMGGRGIRLRGQGPLGAALLVAVVGVMVLGATGAITALGDTLFPAGSLEEGLRQDFDGTAHFLLRLRVIHPAVAVVMGVYVTALAWWISRRRPGGTTELLAWVLTGIFLTQLVLGALNVALLAPVWMQLVHLLMADLLWIALVLLSASALAAAEEPAAAPGRAPRGAGQPA